MKIKNEPVINLAGLIALFVITPAIFAADSKQWLFDMSYSVEDMARPVPVSEKKQCLPATAPIPDISRPGYLCKSRGERWFGKTLMWQVDCSNDWESIQGTGRVSFENNKADGDIHLQIINPTSPPEYMVVAIRGKTLGACKN